MVKKNYWNKLSKIDILRLEDGANCLLRLGYDNAEDILETFEKMGYPLKIVTSMNYVFLVSDYLVADRSN